MQSLGTTMCMFIFQACHQYFMHAVSVCPVCVSICSLQQLVGCVSICSLQQLVGRHRVDLGKGGGGWGAVEGLGGGGGVLG